MSSFAHLHLHTEYSLLDGLGRINDYMARARELGMQHIAITDHGVMYGVLDWYKAAKEHGLTPIIGMEGYMARNGMQDRQDRQPYHLLLLAQNEQGYRNLLQLSSRASIEGFYYRPRFDLDLLRQYSDGLICTSACLAGPVASHLLAGDETKAREMASSLAEIFGPDRFYIELQDHGLPEQKQVLPQLVDLARSMDIPLVAANDVHYLNREDAELQELLICIQTNKTLNDPNRMKMNTDQFYFKSPAEMEQLFSEVPDAISNTVKIAERCAFDLEFGRLHLPDPDIPDGMTAQQRLTELCWEGLYQRYGDPTDEVRQRLEYELYVIEQTGFPSYMLIVQDFAKFARDRGIPFGVRGSAAASIVLYTLGITDIDPIANRLVFERFLNIERREMPDIDMDFADNRRGEVIEYAANKYGHDRVAQIITFGTMGAKASVRDVGRASGWAHADVDRVARLIPSTLNVTLDRALEESSELRNLHEEDPQVQLLIDRARKIEGIARHAGTHAAGVVISKDELVRHLPLQRPARGSDGAELLPTTQFPMETVAEIGLLKMDFLGLSNLTILGEAVDIVKQVRGEMLDPISFPDGDQRTYDMLGTGETFGVFQLESTGMRQNIQMLRPGSVAELAAMVALYRPGPMQHIPTYCRAKHGEEEIAYPHADLSDILDETYGVIVYQDQVLLIAQQFAGYTLGEADIMRKAMGKKIAEKMRAERERFIGGAQERGYSEHDAEKIFDLIEPFAGYAFNKAHAVCYGTIAYQTAYLKASYPAEYMTAVFRLAPAHPSGPTARVAAAFAECQKLGITVLPPDINKSGVQFDVEELENGEVGIRFGLSIVKNVGEAAVEAIVDAREAQPDGTFASLFDLCSSVDVKHLNKRALESLIKCGACDELGTRPELLAVLDRTISAGHAHQKAAQRGQMGLFGGEAESLALDVPKPDDVPAIPKKTLLSWEKEHIGVYVTENPLLDVQAAARRSGITFTAVSELDSELVGQTLRILGLVTSIRKIVTRNNQTMAVLEIEDLGGSIEVVVFPRAYEQYTEMLVDDSALLIKGKVDERNEAIQLIAESIETVEADTEELPTTAINPGRIINIRLSADQLMAGKVDSFRQLAGLLSTFPGDDVVMLTVEINGRSRVLRAAQTVDWCQDLKSAIDDTIGSGNVSAHAANAVTTGNLALAS